MNLNSPVFRSLVTVLLVLLGGWLAKHGIDKGDAATVIGAALDFLFALWLDLKNRWHLQQQTPPPEAPKVVTFNDSVKLLLIGAIVLSALCAGCSTSEPFKYGAHQGVNLLSKRAENYLKEDAALESE